MKDYIIFYKLNGSNIPLFWGREMLLILLPYPSFKKEDIYETYPKARDNLFISIDGIEYKLD